MSPINNHELQLITGGCSTFGGLPAAAISSAVAYASAGKRDATPSNNEYGDTSPLCNQHYPQAVAPKNGDRNSLGQQYSWGTWWDDTN